jgi:hypothetical protein
MNGPSLEAPESSPATSPRGPWSIAALAGFACGLFLIVPFLAGLAAVVLGIAGMRETREPSMRGRRLAMAGIVLGLVNLVGWSAYARFISAISGPGRAVAHRFVADLDAGKTDAAAGQCAGHIDAAQLQAAADQLKAWGGAKSVAILYIDSETANGVTTGTVRGAIHTPRGEHSFQLGTVEQNVLWKITAFSLQ